VESVADRQAGKSSISFYDPLQFMIEESHKRGLEFHAWLNPYRANFSIGKASIAPNHVTKKHPEWFCRTEAKCIRSRQSRRTAMGN